MRNLHAAIITSSILFALGLCGETAKHTLGVPISGQILQPTFELAGVATLMLWCTQMILNEIARTARSRAAALGDEMQTLRNLVASEMQEYGNRRAIEAHLSNERRHRLDQISGQTTEDLHFAVNGGPHRLASVSPLLKRNA